MATRPLSLPEWATSPTAGDVVEPGAAKKSSGWTTVGGIPEKPNYQQFNWYQQLVYNWTAYWADLTDDEFTQLKNIDSVTISNAQWAYVGALNQGLTTGDDVIFNSVTAGTYLSDAINEATLDAGVTIETVLLKDGNVTIPGDLTVNGTTITANTETILIEDNLLVINNGEVGTGVTAGVAGIEVDRGLATNYQFVFRESDDVFAIGEAGSLQAVATREDAPTADGVPYWNDTDKRFDTSTRLTYSSNMLTVGDNTSAEEIQLRAGTGQTTTLRFFENSVQKALMYYSPSDTSAIIRALSGQSVILQSDDTTRLTLGLSAATFFYAVNANTSLTVGTTSQATTLLTINSNATGNSQIRLQENSVNKAQIYYNSNSFNLRGNSGVSTTIWANDTSAVTIDETNATFSRNIVMSSSNIQTNSILEASAAAGVNIDGNLLKDSEIETNGIITRSSSTTFQFASQEDNDCGIYTNQGSWRLGNTGASGHTVISSDFDALIVRSQSASGAQVQFNNNGAKKGAVGFSATANIFIVRDSADGVMLRVDGDIYNNTSAVSPNVLVSTNNILLRATSLRKFKDNISPIDVSDSINVVRNLRPVTYRSKCKSDDQSISHIGLIAEEVETACRSLASYGDGKLAGVQYERVGVVAVAALQGVLERLEAVEARLS